MIIKNSIKGLGYVESGKESDSNTVSAAAHS